MRVSDTELKKCIYKSFFAIMQDTKSELHDIDSQF